MELSTITDESRYFDLVMREAEVLASARTVPAAYRGQASDIVAAGLFGRTFGWDVMTSMQNIHVIEGSASMKPEAMLGLVRRAGHSVEMTVEDGVATAVGKRCDSGDEHTATFSLDDAEKAGIGGKRNWKQYPEAMLTWRAVSKLCRNLFSDVTLGASYVPEELGEETDAEGMPIKFDPAVRSGPAKNQLIELLGRDKAIERWGDRGDNCEIKQSELDELMAIDAEIVEEIEEEIDGV